jgi:hypothetical protein
MSKSLFVVRAQGRAMQSNFVADWLFVIVQGGAASGFGISCCGGAVARRTPHLNPFRYARPAGQTGSVAGIKLLHQVRPVHLYGLQSDPK